MQKLIRRAASNILTRIPPNAELDRWISWFLFAYHNHRLPNKKSLQLSDFVFHLKTHEDFDNPLRRNITDKLAAREHITSELGRDLMAPVLRVWESPDQIDPDSIPDQCVVKPSHLSGAVMIVDKKSQPLRSEDLEIIRSWFRRNHYHRNRERHYLNLVPRVYCEENVMASSTPLDIKALCINGCVRGWTIDINMTSRARTQGNYSADWQPLEFEPALPMATPIPRPVQLDEMRMVAERLSQPFTLMRVDFLVTPEKFYVGELTSLPNGAINRFKSNAEERKYSSYIFGVTEDILDEASEFERIVADGRRVNS